MSKNYRRCVGIIVIREDGKALLCERKDVRGQWQFPQGGIDDGETILEAAYRELREETSLTEVTPAAIMKKALRYRFPEHIKKGGKWMFDGQDMFWVMFRLAGSENAINLQTDEPEFCDFCWADIDEAAKNIVEFKKDVYIKAIEYFKPFIRS